MPISLQYMSLNGGRKLEYPDETPESGGELTSSTHTWLRNQIPNPGGVKPLCPLKFPFSYCFTFKQRWNSRGIKENYITGQHVSLPKLEKQMSVQLPEDDMMKYITKEIPSYPNPVEFGVSEVAHVTNKKGFKGILASEEFNPPDSGYSWWDLKMNKKEIKSAMENYIERNFPNMAKAEKKAFLEKFTTSPLFKLQESRYGNYRFTFPLTDLMQWYKEQNCGGEDPVLRVYETITYKQEIVYTVLIHSPEDNERFGEYPLLEASEWVRYEDGKIIWKAQAICETHWYQLSESGEVQSLNTYQFYVWDQVSLVFHLPKPKALEIPRVRLIEALVACEISDKDLSRLKGPNNKRKMLDANSGYPIHHGSKKVKKELKEEEKEEMEEIDQKDEDEAKSFCTTDHSTILNDHI
ncbi:hypothetical protein QTP70_034606 [Hemibagrus guttatus]|uniref:Uncharacterized protein n=1 Tax=Hemibagrus guttatus TaxID=175788 RepID=A0AAE0R043_9TELE|nr:hypothetical protein QTP70_034606 [Hemibagrus guttatus]